MVVFDEIKFGEDVYKNGLKSKKYIMTELLNIAKYLKHNNIEIKNTLIEFCKKNIENFNMEEWEGILDATLDKANKYPALTGKVIKITKSELDIISELDNIDAQKILFILLVINKFKNYTLDASRAELFKLAEVKANTKKQESILFLLNSKKLTEIYNKTRNNKNHNFRKVTFINDESEVMITINNFDNIIIYYKKYLGENIIECENESCNKLFYPRNNTHKYCKDCAREINIQKTIENRKNRNCLK